MRCIPPCVPSCVCRTVVRLDCHHYLQHHPFLQMIKRIRFSGLHPVRLPLECMASVAMHFFGYNGLDVTQKYVTPADLVKGSSKHTARRSGSLSFSLPFNHPSIHPASSVRPQQAARILLTDHFGSPSVVWTVECVCMMRDAHIDSHTTLSRPVKVAGYYLSGIHRM